MIVVERNRNDVCFTRLSMIKLIVGSINATLLHPGYGGQAGNVSPGRVCEAWRI
jgi:hypothetical protein